MNVLIDTNVILDALMARTPWNKNAEEIILLSAAGDITACVTASSITDIYYLFRKAIGNSASAREAVFKLIQIVDVIDVSAEDCERAFDLPIPDYEDAVQIACAARHKLEHIITRDAGHFSGSPINIASPEAFLGGLQR